MLIIDKHRRNPKYPNVFGVGVCIAIAPLEATPLPVGMPKTAYMIESMVTATALNTGELLRARIYAGHARSRNRGTKDVDARDNPA
jgi:sulfide:quinone oxidoreductase